MATATSHIDRIRRLTGASDAGEVAAQYDLAITGRTRTGDLTVAITSPTSRLKLLAVFLLYLSVHLFPVDMVGFSHR